MSRTVATMAGGLLALASALAGTGCGGDGGGTGTGAGRIFVDSDPRGAAIVLDGKATGLRTPDSVRSVSDGEHTVTVQLDSAGATFALETQVQVSGGGATSAGVLPLVTRCNETGNCVGQAARFHEVASMYFATNPAATLMFRGGQGGGLKYPGPAGDSYASAAGPVFSGKPSTFNQYVALGIYQFRSSAGYPPLWAGRPAPSDSNVSGGLVVRAKTWYAPQAALSNAYVPRGIEVEQRIVGAASVTGALLLRVVFRNISATAGYLLVDPDMPAGGMTYTDAYVGYGLDADIGPGTSDFYTFLPSIATSVLYNAPMQVPGFNGPPGLVGLRLLQRPADAANVALSAWPSTSDWLVADQPAGRAIITAGGQAGNPVYIAPPTAPGDFRISVAAGPVSFAPGDSAAIVVAIVVAPPAAGTYTPGTLLRPGDPADASRQFEAVAAPLVQRARAAEALLSR